MTSLPPTEPIEDVALLSEQGGIRSQSGNWKGQAVFVKTLLTDDPDTVTRFHHEGEIAARVRHPLVHRLLLHTHNQLIFNFVPGGSLRRMLEETAGPLSADGSTAITWGMLRVLRDLHDNGIVHHDIKPENVVLKYSEATADAVRLVDFGMSYMNGLVLDIHSGTRMGTPHFMAPEQFAGQRGDPRSDLYSVGVLLFDCLTGQLPYDNPLGWLIGMTQPEPQWPDLPEVAELLPKSLEREPDKRFQSAEDFMQALEQARAELDLLALAWY